MCSHLSLSLPIIIILSRVEAYEWCSGGGVDIVVQTGRSLLWEVTFEFCIVSVVSNADTRCTKKEKLLQLFLTSVFVAMYFLPHSKLLIILWRAETKIPSLVMELNVALLFCTRTFKPHNCKVRHRHFDCLLIFAAAVIYVLSPDRCAHNVILGAMLQRRAHVILCMAIISLVNNSLILSSASHEWQPALAQTNSSSTVRNKNGNGKSSNLAYTLILSDNSENDV